jgi:hypothetical protein
MDDPVCPQCGLKSSELRPGCQPTVMAQLGKSKRLLCRICERQWIHTEGKDGE